MKPHRPNVEQRVAYALAGSLLMFFTVQRLRALKTNANGSVPRGETVHHAATVNLSVESAYELWRERANLPRFMAHIVSVTPIDATRSHWVAKLPAGAKVEWDSEIVDDLPRERISWRTVGNAAARSEGAVMFRGLTHRNATEITLGMRFAPAGGFLGRGAARLLGENPQSQVKDTLRLFKQFAETGEITTNAMEAGQ